MMKSHVHRQTNRLSSNLDSKSLHFQPIDWESFRAWKEGHYLMMSRELNSLVHQQSSHSKEDQVKQD